MFICQRFIYVNLVYKLPTPANTFPFCKISAERPNITQNFHITYYLGMNKKKNRAAGAKQNEQNTRWYTPATCYGIRYADDTYVELAYQFIYFVYLSQYWLKFVYDGFTLVICLHGLVYLLFTREFFTDFLFTTLSQIGFVKKFTYR